VQRYLGEHGAVDEPGVLEAAQCLGEDLGADAGQLVLQFAEALRALVEGADGTRRFDA
jgi:hypothetical protein